MCGNSEFSKSQSSVIYFPLSLSFGLFTGSHGQLQCQQPVHTLPHQLVRDCFLSSTALTGSPTPQWSHYCSPYQEQTLAAASKAASRLPSVIPDHSMLPQPRRPSSIPLIPCPSHSHPISETPSMAQTTSNSLLPWSGFL